MPKKQEKPWQYKFSFALSLVMLTLVIGYFVQSFQEIRKVQPVRVAIERIADRASQDNMKSEALTGSGVQATADQASASTGNR